MRKQLLGSACRMDTRPAAPAIMPGLAAWQLEVCKPHLSRSTGWLYSALKALRQRVLLQRSTVYVAQRAELAAALVRACTQGAGLYNAMSC